MKKYDHKKIEKKWAKDWEEKKIYKTQEDKDKPKFYILDMFPYPSGAGLHVGHPKGYIATDIFARAKRMKGFNVLHPMGWDAFGLPAENFAIKNKMHPAVCTEKNVVTFKEQLGKLGFSYDWGREINTTDPKFYKWTQWAFIQMFKKGLAYESYEPINWCPSCKTGLANEDLEGGRCERCGSEIEKKPMRQWVLKITDYAERMLQDLDKLPNWDKSIKEMQRNWIGKSEGVKIQFSIKDSKKEIEVFTTRPDTLFGATYMVLAPEHKLIQELKDQIKNWDEVQKYIQKTEKKSEIDRTDLTKEKTGVRLLGVFAVNPANQEEIPVFIADYVLVGYGTGAIMAVPAHDERDNEFATKFGIEVKEVIQRIKKKSVIGVATIIKTMDGKFLLQERDEKAPVAPNEITFFGGGVEQGESPKETLKRELREELNLIIKDEQIVLIDYFNHIKTPKNSSAIFFVDGIDRKKITLHEGRSIIEVEDLKEILNDERANIYTTEFIKYYKSELENKVYTGDGEMVNSEKFDGLDSTEAQKKITEFVGGEIATTYRLQDWVFSRQRYWGEPIPIIHCKKCGAIPLPEDQLPLELPDVKNYEPTGTGESPLAGIKDWVNTTCPKCGGVGKRETNTMPQWAGSSWYYLRFIDPKNDKALIDKNKDKYWSPVDFYVGGAEHATRHLIYSRFWHKFLFDIGVLNYDEPYERLQHVGLILAEDGRKMSKRWGNVINPDEIVETFGADSMRVYEMFMGPFSQASSWSTNGLVGAKRFLEKIWRISENLKNDFESDKDLTKELHKAIKKIGDDIEEFKFNTAVSTMMKLVNFIENSEGISKKDFEIFLKLLAPFAPHITEEIWENLGYTKSIHLEEWPKYDEALAKDERHIVVIQVNGKVRSEIEIEDGESEDIIRERALNDEKIQKWIDGKEVKKIIYIANKLVNIVV